MIRSYLEYVVKNMATSDDIATLNGVLDDIGADVKTLLGHVTDQTNELRDLQQNLQRIGSPVDLSGVIAKADAIKATLEGVAVSATTDSAPAPAASDPTPTPAADAPAPAADAPAASEPASTGTDQATA